MLAVKRRLHGGGLRAVVGAQPAAACRQKVLLLPARGKGRYQQPGRECKQQERAEFPHVPSVPQSAPM